MTPEQEEVRRVTLAKARAAAAENRERRAAAASDPPTEPEPETPAEPEPPPPPPPTDPVPPPAAAAPEPEPIPMAPIVHEGSVAPPVFGDPEGVEDSVDTLVDDDFVRFLMAQDDDTRELLTDLELRVIFETETKRAAEEKKAAARKGALARAQRHARIVAGLIPAEAAEASARLERLSRKVSWTVNMPEAGNSGMLTDIGMRIDGRLLQHGETVVGTLAQWESYREIEWRAHQGELDFQGKGKMSRLRQSATRSLNYVGPRL